MANIEYIQKLIEHFKFEPLHVEGGQFKQTYKARERLPENVLPAGCVGSHPMGTAILYFYTADPDSFSAVHRLPLDETYHFYFGDPVEMLLLYPDGKTARIILGHDVLNGQMVQFTVPRGVWQSSHLLPGGEYALAGTTMSPGYEDSDYEGGEREEMIRLYSQEADLIRTLTRPGAPLRIL
ncbi:MAG: cupin domain-containing protein [Leptolinea sp.]|jgi:predicted cupin superfamily sugar epimerase|nr:cupin domain-containing protein [Leptolinea sp.]